MQSITTDTAPLTELNEALEIEKVKPYFYQAIGFVEGILEIDDEHSTLTIGEDSYPAIVRKRLKAKESQLQCFQVYPATIKGSLGFLVAKKGKLPLSFFTLNGCWEIHNKEPRFMVYRNQQSQNNSHRRSVLPLTWPDAPPADGRFWELKAKLEGHELVVTKAKGSFDPPPHGFQHQQEAVRQEIQITQSPETLAFLAAPPLTTERIQSMVAPTKAQITFHLRELPHYQERPDNRVRFFLNGNNECIFSVLLKPEKFQQLVEHDFEQGFATLTGYMGAPTATGFYLVGTTVNSVEADLASGEQLTEEDATDSKDSDDKSLIDSAVPETKQQSTQKPPTDQKMLAVVAKADNPQEPEAKGAKSKRVFEKLRLSQSPQHNTYHRDVDKCLRRVC
jgi:hypothetical protein